jgi:hypothetical protein
MNQMRNNEFSDRSQKPVITLILNSEFWILAPGY